MIFHHLENKFKLKREIEKIENDSKDIRAFLEFFKSEIEDISNY